MKKIRFPSGSFIYNQGDIPGGVYFLESGKLGVKLGEKILHKCSGSVGEWSLFNIPSSETVVAEEESLFTFIEVDEFLEKVKPSVVVDIIESLQERLQTADEALKKIMAEFSGSWREDKKRKRREASFSLKSPVFSDYARMKHFLFEGNYDEALEIASRYVQKDLPEDLRSEFMIWQCICEASKAPKRTKHLLMRMKASLPLSMQLTSRRYFEFLTYGGTLDPVLKVYAKTGFHFPVGTLVVEEGEESYQLFVVLQGYLEVFKRSEEEEGSEIFLSFLRPGEFFGEAAITGHKRLASVRTITPVDLIALDSQQFKKEISDHPSFGLSIAKGELLRIQNVVQLMEIFACEDRKKRIRAFLKIFPDVIENARFKVDELAEILHVELVTLITTLRSSGFLVGSDGTIKPG
ncbi:MAG: hypothetical protein PWP37_1341 [Thermotogota bacterium]|nr:hypothetical protein [Thermotogota bacterium]MDK2865149.1 hypothetical protein [Thermotogota bacterium]HCZ05941.1 hypothetical protein [Thermotogota bacterium]